MNNHEFAYRVARQSIDECEQEMLPMVVLTVNEKGNLNVITNMPGDATGIELICKLLDQAKLMIAQKKGN